MTTKQKDDGADFDLAAKSPKGITAKVKSRRRKTSRVRSWQWRRHVQSAGSLLYPGRLLMFWPSNSSVRMKGRVLRALQAIST
jgi:hypothetical protein